MRMKTHVDAPASTNSKRLKERAREGFVSMCACTERDGTDIGTVEVNGGGQRRRRLVRFDRRQAPLYFCLWKPPRAACA